MSTMSIKKTLSYSQLKKLLSTKLIGENTVLSSESEFDDNTISFKCGKNHLSISVSVMKVLSDIRTKQNVCVKCQTIDCQPPKMILTTGEKIAFTYLSGRRSTDEFKIPECDARYIESCLSNIKVFRNDKEIPYSFYLKKLHIAIVVVENDDNREIENSLDKLCIGTDSDISVECWVMNGISINKMIYYSTEGLKTVVKND